MALLLPLEDEEFWRGLLQADAEFRACMEQVVATFEVEIDVPKLEASFSLSAAINVRIGGLQARLAAIQHEIPCLDIILNFLVGQTNSEALSWRDTILARKTLLVTEQASIEAQLVVLPSFSVSTQEVTDNLITTGKNATFFSGILDDLAGSP